MTKSQPVSVRLSPEFGELVADEARRTRRSKGAVIEDLAAEALKCRIFPGIGFREGPAGRRAWLRGTSLDVWQVVDAYRDFGSVEAMARTSDLTERQIRLALTYYERFPSEIDEMIARNRAPIEELRRQFPSFASNA
jgi:uncharacterized protein (DUF433 family)